MTDIEMGQRTLHALERIAAALELMAAPAQEPVDPVGCEHPMELRTDFGVTGGLPDWRCACGFRSIS